MYKFVSAGRYNPGNRAANLQLLDAGTLYAAKLRDDGSGEWLPLAFVQGLLTSANGASYQSHQDVSWLATPDNIAFDEAGRMWIATDGQPEAIKVNDALYAVDTEGPEHGRSRMFLSGPLGCEICGPAFTPDNRTLFVAIQHPGEGKGATFAQPVSRWPDGHTPPWPSIVAVYRPDGGTIGS